MRHRQGGRDGRVRHDRHGEGAASLRGARSHALSHAGRDCGFRQGEGRGGDGPGGLRHVSRRPARLGDRLQQHGDVVRHAVQALEDLEDALMAQRYSLQEYAHA